MAFLHPVCRDRSGSRGRPRRLPPPHLHEGSLRPWTGCPSQPVACFCSVRPGRPCLFVISLCAVRRCRVGPLLACASCGAVVRVGPSSARSAVRSSLPSQPHAELAAAARVPVSAPFTLRSSEPGPGKRSMLRLWPLLVPSYPSMRSHPECHPLENPATPRRASAQPLPALGVVCTAVKTPFWFA